MKALFMCGMFYKFGSTAGENIDYNIKSHCKIVKKIIDFVFCYRYWIGGAVFILGVILEINGSSIGCWELLVKEGETGKVLLGNSRVIRGDEWNVGTSMLLSQYKEGFPYFNNLCRATLTDMFIVYGQPVRDIAVLFRPFHWGYLFLPFAKGLAFYWCGKNVALALVSFELGMLISNKSRLLSFVYMIMICLAPVTQWWFAVNAFPDMLIYAQLAIVLIYYYFKTSNYRIRFVQGILFALCCGAYALVFYPAWQIPFAYVFFVLALWVILQHRQKMSWKHDGVILGVSMLLLITGLGYVIIKSWDTIQSIINTAYPGERCETGGNVSSCFAFYPGNLFFSWKDPGEYGVVAPEWSVMFDLFPIGQLLAIAVYIREKRKDFLLIVLEIVWVILITFVVFGVDKWIAQITFLSQSTTTRVNIAVGYLNILILIRSLALVRYTLSARLAVGMSAVISVCMVFVSKKYVYGLYLNGLWLLLTILLLFIMYFCLFESSKRFMMQIFAVLITGVLLYSSGLVNPIRVGIYDVGATELGGTVQALNERNPGIWLDATGMNGLMGEFLEANGVAIINSTNTYPVLERWYKLDSRMENEYIYNRYAHIGVDIVYDSSTSFSLVSPDAFNVNLNVDDIDKLTVKYLLVPSTKILEDTTKISFELLYSDQQFSIYGCN